MGFRHRLQRGGDPFLREDSRSGAAHLSLVEPDRIDDAFDDAVEELAKRVNHHLTEEELTILNPARAKVPAPALAELGTVFATERNALIDDDCGRLENVRAIVERAEQGGLLEGAEAH